MGTCNTAAPDVTTHKRAVLAACAGVLHGTGAADSDCCCCARAQLCQRRYAAALCGAVLCGAVLCGAPLRELQSLHRRPGSLAHHLLYDLSSRPGMAVHGGRAAQKPFLLLELRVVDVAVELYVPHAALTGV